MSTESDKNDTLQSLLFAETEETRRLREKVASQTERIRYLEGATSWATGTPLTKALDALQAVIRANEELGQIDPASRRTYYEESILSNERACFLWEQLNHALKLAKNVHATRGQ